MWRVRLQLLALAILIALYAQAVYCVFNPRVSREYKEFYIEEVASDWSPTHYAATPEEGLTFKAAGLPTFVRDTYGLSFREPWGRWTDTQRTAVPRIVLAQALSGPICLIVNGQAVDWEKHKPVMVSFGNEKKAVTFDRAGYSDYLIDFAANQPADTLEFKFSEVIPPADEVSPRVRDHRRLGLALVSLRLFHETCAHVRVETAAAKEAALGGSHLRKSTRYNRR